MLEWIKFQKKTYGGHDEFLKKKASPELIEASQNILDYIKENNISYGDHPLLPAGYEYQMEKLHNKLGYEFPRSKVHEWIRDPNSQQALGLSIRDLFRDKLPDVLVEASLEAVKKQENVLDNLVLARSVVLHPGDNTCIHYDAPIISEAARQGIDGQFEGKRYVDKRGFLFMHDQMPGQVSWIGDTDIEFKQYDFFVFEMDKVIHGAANFGYHDRYILCYTWAEPL